MSLDAAVKAFELDSEEKDALLTRIDHAGELFGGTDVVRRFRAWKTPEER